MYIRSANWLADEINRNAPGDPVPQTNCVAFCDLLSSPISGIDDVVCNTNYSVSLVAGVTYLWTTSSNLTINGSNTNNTVQVSPIVAGGSGWIEVQLTTTCGQFTIRKNVSLTDYSEAELFNEGINIQVFHPSNWSIWNYRWYMDGVFFRQTNAPLLKTTLVNQCHGWSVSFVTACGESPETYPISIGCGNRAAASEYNIYPNPVKDNTITVEKKTRRQLKWMQNRRIWCLRFMISGCTG